MCLMCEEEAFYQAYMAYLARKQGEASAAEQESAFKAEAVDRTDDSTIPSNRTSDFPKSKLQSS